MAALIRVYDLHRIRERRPRVFRERIGFGDLSPEDVFSRYRFDMETINFIVETIQDDVECPSNRGRPVDTLSQVLVTLRYLAKGDFYSEIADCQGVSRSTVCRIVARVVSAINRRFLNIRFPTDEQGVREMKLGFYRKCKIPNVVGAIDGTLVPIMAPSADEAVYVCRKGFHALNVQAVVDHKMRFLDVVAKWPGSQHDSSVFDSCGLKEHLVSSKVGYLLGDSGYPLRSYLLTPILNPATAEEERYNSAHSRGRVTIERTFGVLKSRFRCLHKTGGCLMMSPDRAAGVITACMRLHNLCIDRHVPLPDTIDVTVDTPEEAVQPTNDACGLDVRQSVIRLM